jgi:hypothetical protein
VVRSVRRHAKYFEPRLEGQLARLRASLQCYRFIIDYCDRHGNHGFQVGAELRRQAMPGASPSHLLGQEELDACREMAALLPLKIERMTAA